MVDCWWFCNTFMYKIHIMRSLFFALFSFCTLMVCAQTAGSLYNEGFQLKKEKKSRDAAGKFMEALQLNKDYTEARYELGWCQNDIGAYSAAIDNLRMVRQAWDNVPKVFFELGYAFQKNEMTDSAIAAYNRCLELKPDYAGVFKQLGYIYYDKDDKEKTLDYFGKYIIAAKTEISDYFFWYRKGFTENASKKYEQAIESLKKSLQYKTDYLNTYLELGFAYTKLKQDDNAVYYYQKAIEIEPQSHIPYNGIAEVYRDNKKDMDKAMEWYQKTLKIKSTERKACFGMGYCLNSKSRYSEAIPYLKQAIASEGTYTAAYVEYGYALYKTGNNADAIINLNKALELHPQNENARYYATLIYVSQNNKPMAQKMVDELRKLNSKYANELQIRVDKMQ